jgi:GNAT superfamily N-acetyltransferase
VLAKDAVVCQNSRVSTIEPTRKLLLEVFPQDEKFHRSDFLEWEYCQSPSGPVIEQNADDSLGRLGHYALVPQRWRRNGAIDPWALSLNTAVSERARGQGLFTKLAEAAFTEAKARGIPAVIGVANAQSTPGFIGRLGFDLLGPLEVKVMAFRPGRAQRQIERISIDDLLNDAILLDHGGASGSRRVWDRDELSWRLRCPGRQFTLLRTPEAAAVTCASHYRGVPVGIILKVFVASGNEPIDLAPIASSACQHYRAPVALYAGFNPGVRARGIRLPDRFRPSPLNLIVRSLDPGVTSASVSLDCFEFLEFDAY